MYNHVVFLVSYLVTYSLELVGYLRTLYWSVLWIDNNGSTSCFLLTSSWNAEHPPPPKKSQNSFSCYSVMSADRLEQHFADISPCFFGGGGLHGRLLCCFGQVLCPVCRFMDGTVPVLASGIFFFHLSYATWCTMLKELDKWMPGLTLNYQVICLWEWLINGTWR